MKGAVYSTETKIILQILSVLSKTMEILFNNCSVLKVTKMVTHHSIVTRQHARHVLTDRKQKQIKCPTLHPAPSLQVSAIIDHVVTTIESTCHHAARVQSNCCLQRWIFLNLNGIKDVGVNLD